MSRCEKHDIEITSCADCRPRPGQAQATAVLPDALRACPCGRGDRELCPVHGPGPWFIADYNGTCSGCGENIEPDDEIRADGQGGWERRECCGEYEASTRVISGPVRLVSRGLDPAHPGYVNLTRPAARRSL